MTAKMKRREFITLCGGAAAAWPLMSRAADGDAGDRRTARGIASGHHAPRGSLLRRVEERSYVEAQNVRVEYRDGGRLRE